MDYILTSKDFTASHWRESFDEVVFHQRIDDFHHKFKSADSVWLCTIIREWTDILASLSAGDKKVVVLAISPGSDEAKHALSLGANGYLGATATPDLIQKVKTTVHAGGYWIPNELLLTMLGQFNAALNAVSTAAPDPRLQRLTQREREVCYEVAKGSSNKVIARQLHITERTVKEHLSRSFAKLEVKDRMQVMLLINGKLPGDNRPTRSGSQ